MFNIAYRAIELMHQARTGIHVDPLPPPREDTTSEVSLPAAQLERNAGFSRTNGIDPGDDMVQLRSLELREQSGFLVLDLETFAIVSQGSLP